MKTSIIIICSSLAATFVTDALEMPQYPNPNLKGTQAQSATSDEFHNLDRHLSIEMDIEIDNHVALSDSGYTYQFQMDLSTPLLMTFDGKPLIDSCINWDNFPDGGGVRPTNFTWYGISFQLPEDTRALFGVSDAAPAQPLKENGFVHNDTAVGVAKYNFATYADRPVIRARINNGFLWNTFTFDFTGGSNYFEQRSQQSVSCTVEENANGTVLRSVVNPTLTVSLERLSSPGSAPAPEPSSSSMAGSLFAITAFASSVLLLL